MNRKQFEAARAKAIADAILDEDQEKLDALCKPVGEYMREDGKHCSASHELRAVWYGQCGYWTDNWAMLRLMGPTGIPVCPHCAVPGFITNMQVWLDGAERHQKNGHPEYVVWLKATQELCYGRNQNTMERYQKWLTSQRQDSPPQN